MDERGTDPPQSRQPATPDTEHLDSPANAVRRIARRVTPRSAHGVLLRVIQEVLDPHWSPASAARSIVAHVDGEVGPLRGARAQLLAATVDRATVSRARALATINLAIAQIEAARADLPGPDSGTDADPGPAED